MSLDHLDSGDTTDDLTDVSHVALEQVLDALASLEHRPVAEHVAVYEDAHGRLRQALDAPAQPERPSAG